MKLKLLSLMLLVALASCSKGTKKLPEPQKAIVSCKEYDTWTYYSFEKGIIGIYKEGEFDYKNSKDWDIAFHRWDIRTNGGLSGSGKGAAFETPYSNLFVDDWDIPIVANNWVEDTMIKTYMSVPNMNSQDDKDQRVETPANTALAKWMNVTMSTIPPTYQVYDKAFLIRTAAGKYAAILFTNYMNDKAEKGYVNFDYVYPIK